MAVSTDGFLAFFFFQWHCAVQAGKFNPLLVSLPLCCLGNCTFLLAFLAKNHLIALWTDGDEGNFCLQRIFNEVDIGSGIRV